MDDELCYEKLLYLEAIKRCVDEEEKMMEILTQKYAEYEKASRQFEDMFNLYTRLVSNSRNISTIAKISRKLRSFVNPQNMIAAAEVKEIIPEIYKVVKHSFFCNLPSKTVLMMQQEIANLNFDVKLVKQIYDYIQKNSYLKAKIDQALMENEKDIAKVIPRAVDALVLYK